MPGIFSVHSFRHGTGKSLIAANLAALLTRTGRRVGIIDIDLAAPSMHLFFDLDESQTTPTVNDYLLGVCAIEDAAHGRLHRDHPVDDPQQEADDDDDDDNGQNAHSKFPLLSQRVMVVIIAAV